MRALPALLLLGCSSLVDGTVPGYDRVTYTGPHSDRDVGLALHLFAAEWDEAFGYEVDLSRLEIVEAEIDAAGYAPTPSRVLIYPSEKLSSTALAHELVHIALWRHELSPDHDHASGVGPWTLAHDDLVVAAEMAMREAGL